MVTGGAAISQTLGINELVRGRLLAGEEIVHLAFGEAGLPVPAALLDLVREGAATNGYGPVAGPQRLREAVAGYLGRRGVPSHADLIAMTPGSKPALFALVSSIAGDVVIPRPSWVSYAAHAALAGRNVLSVPIGDGGGVPDPVALVQALDRAEAQGRKPGILIVTVPDNPTGTVAGAEQIERVLSIAAERGLTVISDEIYRDLAFDPSRLVTPGMVMPDHVIVTGGLSKSVALGGWRIGFARFPDTARGRELRARVLSIASEVWSCIASPMAQVACHVFDEPPEVRRYVASARRLHELVSRRVHELFLRAGALCHTPPSTSIRTSAWSCPPKPAGTPPPAPSSPGSCSTSSGSPCCPERRSATTRRHLASGSRRACCTDARTPSAGRRCRAAIPPRSRGSPASSSRSRRPWPGSPGAPAWPDRHVT
jgi:aspartate aminotransferase